MRLLTMIRISNRNLLRSKLRTSLTVLAIFVGAFTLCLTNGVGAGLRSYVEQQVKNIEGKTILFVRKKFPREEEQAAAADTPIEYKRKVKDEKGNIVDPNSVLLTMENIRAVAGDIKEVRSITPAYRVSAEYITMRGKKRYLVSLGMFSGGFVQKLEAGSMFTGPREVILPLYLARAFDPGIDNLIGKTAVVGYRVGEKGEIKRIPLMIAGVATKGFMANLNAFVDTETAKLIHSEQLKGSPNLDRFQRFTFRLNTADPAILSAVKTKLESRGFRAESIADMKKRTYDAIGLLQIGLNMFALVALLAASFGIINTLVIAVMERTKEVGLQKAMGMGRWQVFLLFSFESVLIGFWGALSGIISAVLIGFGVNRYLAATYLGSFEGYSLFVFTPLAMISVFVLVCAIAFFAGVMPAFRASRLNPIEALRYE